MEAAAELPETTKAKIILYLKKHGEASVNLISEYLNLTSMAVRKHLNILTIQGEIKTRAINKKIGRPLILYFINENVGIDKEFAVEILDSVKENYGDSVVVDLIDRRNKKFYKKYEKRLTQKTIYERVHETVRIFNEVGFETTIEKDKSSGKLLIKHNFCPLLEVAFRHPVLCLSETEVLETFLGAKVERVCHFCDGGKSCSYEVILD